MAELHFPHTPTRPGEPDAMPAARRGAVLHATDGAGAVVAERHFPGPDLVRAPRSSGPAHRVGRD
jgi:hypothetical protein